MSNPVDFYTVAVFRKGSWSMHDGVRAMDAKFFPLVLRRWMDPALRGLLAAAVARAITGVQAGEVWDVKVAPVPWAGPTEGMLGWVNEVPL